MFIGDALAAALPELRAQAESRMFETVTIRRPIGTTSDDAGADVTTFEDAPVYAGPAEIKSTGENDHEISYAGSVVMSPERARLPALSGPYKVGDEIEVTASQFQPHLVGHRYRITSTHEGGLQTAQRPRIERWIGNG